MKKSFAVVGLGRFGRSIALTLMESGAEVLAIDNDSERVKHISSSVTCALNIDACDTDALKSAGIENMDGVIVAMGHNLEAGAMTIITAKELGVPYVLAKSNSDEMTKILLRIGADRVVYPEKDAGAAIAKQILCKDLLEYFEIADNVNLAEIGVRPEWVGKTVGGLDLRKKYKLNIILIRNDDKVTNEIHPDLVLKQGDKLIVTLSDEGFKRIMQ